MKISVSSYSFAQYVGAGKMTQLDCVSKAKEMGFDAIEFTDIHGTDFDEQLENAKKLRAEAERVGNWREFTDFSIYIFIFVP